ncbi:unnamed protein product [Brassica napus]|uniref:(rape) hypothetical protein n=1 Tax=Brassica napus TaxID=3708 RepID=A0A817AWW1_BRANA|nr:unnamed protein product [Brassica napus]
MSESRLHLHFLLLLVLCCVSPFSTTNPDDNSYVVCGPHQTQALNEFMNEFDSSHCNLSDPFNGVWCDNSTGAVTKLQLSACLSGTLKPNSSLFRLHHLRYLLLIDNNFISSSLPSEFGNLSRLEYLSLKNNRFFSGQVPPTISNLTSLTKLDLEDNHLTGSFPLVQNFTMLSAIDVSENQFSGTIPSSLTTMPFLSILDLSDNDFIGSIEFPNSSTPSRLEYLSLGNNHFEGKIIEPISKLISLNILDLSFLNTSYPIDVSLFSSLKSLLKLDLSGNSISPASLGSNLDISKNLEVLKLSGCGISEFPNILKILLKLEYIDISGNSIKGKVPAWLWKLPRLNTLYVSNNSFDGFEGPVDVLINSSVKNLFMEQNCFEGAIPALPLSINIFSAKDNSFTGSIPLSICNCRSLSDLWLSYNNLTGPIPQCLSKLTVVNLRKNNLEGSIPDTFYIGASLRRLDVGRNRLTRKLPRSLQNCSSLEFLAADHNRIKGKFPFWLKALPNLEVLILSSNKFDGSISPPDQGPLGFPELRIFEISDNKFTGSLPPRYFANWKASSLTMNEDGDLYMVYRTTPYGRRYFASVETIDLRYKGLLMEQEMETCFGTIAPPTQQPPEEEEGEDEEVLNWKCVGIGYGPGVLLGLTIAQVIASYKPEWLGKIIGPDKRRNHQAYIYKETPTSRIIPVLIHKTSRSLENTRGERRITKIFFNLNTDDNSYVACPTHQTQALTEFMNEFGSSQCNLSDPFNGVWCDNLTGAITMLQLRSCLSGTLKPNSSLFRLHHLRHLDLNQNNFISSSLPSEFGNLNSSSIPYEFGNLNKLEVLSLLFNDFFGQVPPTISNLTSLKELYLHHNQLTGSFPLVQNLTMLSFLDFSFNRFSGTIPSSITTMPFLSYLALGGNDLTGSIAFPNSSTPSRLEYLYLGNNHFEGKIIDPISKLTNLKLLELSYLNTSYPVDLSLFSSLKSLLRLDLSGCGISKFPSILKTLEKLEFIALNSNRIKGKSRSGYGTYLVLPQ